MAASVLPNGYDLTAMILSFLANDEGRLDHFFLTTGLTMDGLREAADTPIFAEAVIEYVLEDEQRILAFAQFAEVRPEDVARLQYPGGQAIPSVQRLTQEANRGPSAIARRFGIEE